MTRSAFFSFFYEVFKKALFVLVFANTAPLLGQSSVAVLEYGGGGDWYANPTSLPNLVKFATKEGGLDIHSAVGSVSAQSISLFSYSFLHMTGHGSVSFSADEAAALRTYLQRGGFLHIDDNYGMDPFVKKAIESVLPRAKWVLLPKQHDLFRGPFSFPSGLPKIHEHDGKSPEAWGLFIGKRMVVLYTKECDLGDGWEDPEVHQDPHEVRLRALQMGTNILHFVFRGQIPWTN